MRQSVAALLVFVSLAAPAAAQTRVVMLGSGTPNADPDRSGPAIAVVVNHSVYLVDAGPGIVRRAEAARRHGVADLTQPNLKTVFLTHLHSDHTLGLPDLIFTPWVLGRTAALEVYGPRGTRAMVAHISAAWLEDQQIRITGGQPHNETGQHANAHEIQPGTIYRDSNVTVIAFKVAHGTWPESYGYRFEAKDRTIVISGDTGPTDAAADACHGCDVLLHEVYSATKFAEQPAEWRRYHAAFHTSTSELARIAVRGRPSVLVLYHQLFWGATPEALVAEIHRAGYAGRVVSASDLDIF